MITEHTASNLHPDDEVFVHSPNGGPAVKCVVGRVVGTVWEHDIRVQVHPLLHGDGRDDDETLKPYWVFPAAIASVIESGENGE